MTAEDKHSTTGRLIGGLATFSWTANQFAPFARDPLSMAPAIRIAVTRETAGAHVDAPPSFFQDQGRRGQVPRGTAPLPSYGFGQLTNAPEWNLAVQPAHTVPARAP